MQRNLVVLLFTVLFASGCTIEKRQYRNGWYVNRHNGEAQEPTTARTKTIIAFTSPEPEALLELISHTVTIHDTLTRLPATVAQKDSTVLTCTPLPASRPGMTYRQAKASLAAKGIPMDSFFKAGYYLSLILLVAAIVLWPLSIVLLIAAKNRRNKYSNPDVPGSEEHMAIADRMIRNLWFGFLVAAIFYVGLMVLFLVL